MRLFTFGCSFTKYYYPTWADMLGLSFEEHYNYGIPGIGNRAIMERVMEAHAAHNIRKEDVVIVQWTGHFRHDWHVNKDLSFLHRPSMPSWQTCGPVYQSPNDLIYNKDWFDIFFNEESYIMHSFNSVYAVINILEFIGCKWKFTSVNGLKNCKDNLNDKNFWKEFHDLEIYQEPIFDNIEDKWANNMIDYFDLANAYIVKNKVEQHLSCEQHLKFLEKEILSDINIIIDKMTVEEWVNDIRSRINDAKIPDTSKILIGYSHPLWNNSIIGL